MAAVALATTSVGSEPAAACATKPFGQCSGMNFTTGGAGFNFSGSAEPFACCPDGMSCLVMGPVWGMCMPCAADGSNHDPQMIHYIIFPSMIRCSPSHARSLVEQLVGQAYSLVHDSTL